MIHELSIISPSKYKRALKSSVSEKVFIGRRGKDEEVTDIKSRLF